MLPAFFSMNMTSNLKAVNWHTVDCCELINKKKYTVYIYSIDRKTKLGEETLAYLSGHILKHMSRQAPVLYVLILFKHDHFYYDVSCILCTLTSVSVFYLLYLAVNIFPNCLCQSSVSPSMKNDSPSLTPSCFIFAGYSNITFSFNRGVLAWQLIKYFQPLNSSIKSGCTV